MVKERLYYIDNLKALLILLVVLGHCIQNLDLDFDNNIIFRYIYSFHMPLFMFVSGFLSYRKEYKWESLRRRFVQLVIPFISWAILDMSIRGDFNIRWLTDPDSALWFLWVLFWIGVIHISLSKLSMKMRVPEEIIIGIGCCLLIAILMFSKLSFGFHLIAWYLPFYVMGCLTMKYQHELIPFLNKIRIPLLLIFLVSAYFWMRNSSPLFIDSNSQMMIFGYKFFVGVIGSLSIFSLLNLWNYRVLYISELGGGNTWHICYSSNSHKIYR